MNKKIRVGCLLFITILAIFTYTAGRYHVSIADSDEFSTIGYTLGVAHAPGYPLFISIIYAFTHIIPFGSIAFRANMVSALFNALTVTIVYFITLEILRNVKFKGMDEKIKRKKYKTVWKYVEDIGFIHIKVIIAVLSSLMLAFSFLFWLYSNVVEVFALNNFFVSIIIFLTLRLTSICIIHGHDALEGESTGREVKVLAKKQQIRPIMAILIIIAVSSGLALSHLQTIIIIYPIVLGYLLFIVIRGGYAKFIITPRHLFILISALIGSFLFPYILLVYFNSLHTPVSWNLGGTFSTLIAYILRSNYIQGSGTSSNAYIHSVDAGSLQTFAPYMQSVITDFTWMPVLFSIIGCAYLFIKNRRLLLYLSGLYITAGILFALYIQYPFSADDIAKHFGDIAVLQRQYIMGDVILSFLFGVGLYAIFKICLQFFKNNSLSKTTEYHWYGIYVGLGLIIVLSCASIIPEFTTNLSQVNLNNFSYIEAYSKNALKVTKPNAVIVCFSDVSCFSYMYEQVVNHTRPDVTIVPFSFDIRRYYLSHQKNLQLLQYATDPFDVNDVVSWNIYNNKPVYIADLPQNYIEYLGLEGQAFYLLPAGALLEVSKQIPVNYNFTYSYKSVDDFITYFRSIGGTDSKVYWYKFLAGYMTKPIALNAYVRWESGQRSSAITEVTHEYSDYKEYETLSHYEASVKQYSTAAARFNLGDHTPDANSYFSLMLGSSGNLHNQYIYAQRTLLLDPLNIQARLTLADNYRDANVEPYISEAKVEYENVLRLQPNNAKAEAALNVMNSNK